MPLGKPFDNGVYWATSGIVVDRRLDGELRLVAKSLCAFGLANIGL